MEAGRGIQVHGGKICSRSLHEREQTFDGPSSEDETPVTTDGKL